MPEATNAMTDGLRLVEAQTINSLFSQTLHPEYGFSLELFRGNSYVGSLRPNQTQTLTAKRGDILYRINLSPHKQVITGYLRTQERYTREYSVQVEFQVLDPSRFLVLYRQELDPVRLAVQEIRAALQSYASRAIYEEMRPANIENKARYAFDKEPGNLKAGLRIVGVSQPTLGEDAAYQPINPSPLLTINSKVTSREGYVCNYTLTVELSVVDPQFYRHVEDMGASPLERATDTIKNVLQSYARQQFYEDLSASHMHGVVEHAFEGLSNQFIGGIKIVHIHDLSLEADKNYVPVDLNPPLTLKGQLTTREGYVRSYALTIELNVTDYKSYRSHKHAGTGATPLDRVKTAIDSGLREYARQQFYEDLTDLELRPIVKQAFDNITDTLKSCLAITRVYDLVLGIDTAYRPVDRSPLLTMQGQLTTLENYVRDYELVVELNISDRWLHLQLTREGTDPLNLAKVAIDGELQKYARQNFYEDLSEIPLLTVVERAFDELPSRITGGLQIVRPHRLFLEEDGNYQPVNLSPLLSVNGQLTTREGYLRDYSLTVELLVNDRRLYQQLIYEGADPLNYATVAIKGEIQQYARQQFYEDLSEDQLFMVVQKAFDNLSSRVIGDITIVHPHRLFLGEDTAYQPLSLSPLLTMDGQLITKEGYKRNYLLAVELIITDRLLHLQLTREGTDPLNLAKVAIDGELQKYASQQFYEDLSEASLLIVVEHVFDDLPSRATGGLQIVRPHRLSLGEDPNYQPLNLSPLLVVNGQLTTLENYVCDYDFSVEIRIKDRRHYQEMLHEGIVPLDHAKVAISGELQKYARQHFYEALTRELSNAQLYDIVEQAFDNLSSRVTDDMEIVRTHLLDLKEPAGYVHLGPRTLTVTGTLKTMDFRERDYEITVMLEVNDRSEFTRLTRLGGDSDPLNLVRIAIEGATQRVAEAKKHDELSEADLSPAAYKAFSSFAGATIGGLKIAEAYKAILHADPRLREEAEIIHQSRIDTIRLEHQMALGVIESKLKFESTYENERRQLLLDEARQIREKQKYLFELEKSATTAAQQSHAELGQKLLANWTTRISEDLEAGVPVSEIVEQVKGLNRILQPGIVQNVPENGSNGVHQLHSGPQLPQIGPTSSLPRCSKKNIVEWGIEVEEIPLSPTLRLLADNQERAFQICDMTESVAIPDSPFQETDILIKIAGKRVYTLEALEEAIMGIQSMQKVHIVIVRNEARKLITLVMSHGRGNERPYADNTLE